MKLLSYFLHDQSMSCLLRGSFPSYNLPTAGFHVQFPEHWQPYKEQNKNPVLII